jgi:predicted HAD superfamily Cof-like phosphohydrolase
VSSTPESMLAEFHEKFNQPFGSGDVRDFALRQKLNLEESLELDEAFNEMDLVKIAGELADVLYVAYGTAHTLGIPILKVLIEVHRANMDKFGSGEPKYRDDGKLLKPDGWKPADVASVLRRNGVPNV